MAQLDGRKMTHYWSCYREKQEADGLLKELKDQLEAEQYFTVSPSRLVSLSCAVRQLHAHVGKST